MDAAGGKGGLIFLWSIEGEEEEGGGGVQRGVGGGLIWPREGCDVCTFFLCFFALFVIIGF